MAFEWLIRSMDNVIEWLSDLPIPAPARHRRRAARPRWLMGVRFRDLTTGTTFPVQESSATMHVALRADDELFLNQCSLLSQQLLNQAAQVAIPGKQARFIRCLASAQTIGH